MRRQLHTITKANGFFLPYSMFITVLIFLNVSTVIILYENKIITQRTMNELIEVETLIQMSKEQFKQDMHNLADSGEINYTHPNGTAILAYNQIESEFQINVTVHTEKGTNHIKHFFISSEYRGDGDKREE